MPFFDHLQSTYALIFGGAASAIALGLLIAAAWVLPRGQRRMARGSALLLLLHILAVATRLALPEDSPAVKIAELTALFFALASIGRSAFLITIQAGFVRKLGVELPQIVKDLIQVGIYTAVALITLGAAGVEPGSLLATSALLTAVIGLSLQDTLGNMFAGLAIQIQRPFSVGDWISFDDRPDHLGEIVEINWRATRVITIEEVEITIPNGELAKSALNNYARPLKRVRRQILVVAPYDVPPNRVQTLLLEQVSAVEGVLKVPAPSVVVDDFTERGVQYAVRYFLSDFHRRDVIAGMVRERSWYGLTRAGITIPPPLRRIALEQLTDERRERLSAEQTDLRERALANVDFLSSLPSQALRELAQRASIRLYGPGERIIRQDEAGDELFVIQRGTVSVLLKREGTEAEVAHLPAGKFFGEMSLLTGQPRSATVVALDECEIITVGKQAFEGVLTDHPAVLENITQVLSNRSVELNGKTPLTDSERASMTPPEPGELLRRIKRFFSE